MEFRCPPAHLVTLLQEALQKCDELHDSKCQATPIANRSPNHVPDWVIDTQEGCIVPGGSVNGYAALSYVWSSALSKGGNQASTDRLILQRDNLFKFRQPGFLFPETGVMEKLPLVIRDSMELVRLCGVRYLWVDCLCIAQYDETTAVQVSFMREIYSGACFTIIAAANSAGLYGSETNFDSFRAPDGQVFPDSLHGALLASHWATRGWTFQEQMLSKRSLIFLDATAFWDCQTALWWSESLISFRTTHLGGFNTSGDSSHKSSRQALSEFDSENSIWSLACALMVHTADRQRSQDLATLSMPNFRLYMELVCRYNHRNLTYAQDALPAIDGVLDSFTHGFPGGFISGLPAVFLDSSLLWQPRYKAKRRIAVPSVENVAPHSALPSWSWAGWQCLIDPVSLESGLDYELRAEDNQYYVPDLSTTRRLVDWFTLTTDGELCIREPELLERCKQLLGGSRGAAIPRGWSPKAGVETYETVEYMDTGSGSDSPTLEFSVKQRQTNWYFHGSDATSLYRYPLPTTVPQSTIHSQNNSPFLSCTTAMATFKVRRVLVPQVRVTPQMRMGASLSVSVLDTKLYRKEPQLEECCPVITLEDDRQRWAGLLRSMDDDLGLEAGQTVHVMAISQGSTSYSRAAVLYEERVDRVACFRFGGFNCDHYHFGLPESVPKIQEGDLETISEHSGDPDSDNTKRPEHSSRRQDHVDWKAHPWRRDFRAGWGNPRKVTRNEAGSIHIVHATWGDPESDSECYTSMENKTAGLDQGPFFRKDFGCTKNEDDDDLPSEWKDKSYDFYNVLWVWKSGDVMYRKAAGRVPKDIWEKNCGPPQKITLG